MAVGGVVAIAVLVIVLLTNGDSGTTNGDDSSAISVSSSDPSDPVTGPTTSDPVATPDSTATRPTTSEADNAVTAGTLATVPVDTVVVLDPIPLDEAGDFGTGLSVQLVEIEAIEGEATIQGEIAGPALRVEVELTNNSDEPISLERTQVEITYGEDRAPGILLTGSGTTPFAETVAPGDSTTGIVVFVVPVDQRDLVQVVVTQTTATPIVVFEGSAP